MRNFFSKGIKGLFEESKDVQINPSPNNNKSDINTLQKRGSKSNVFGSPGNKMDDKEAEQFVIKSIYNAAQCLSETIQEILSNTASLTGDNLSGFLRLIEVLDSSRVIDSDNPSKRTESNGMGCLQLLLDNISHTNFIELCNQAGLALALMHALRLIRMFEIKRGKIIAYSNESLRKMLDPSNSMNGKSITFKSSQRVCSVFAHLCSNGQTTEQIRQSIVKLLTFPLSVLPLAGVHIQQHSVNIISSMCRTGFTSQQVWYLHDAQAVTHMIRHLNDLTILDQVEQSNENENIEGNNNVVTDSLLRGLSAESEDMWINGVQCIVDVLAASVAVSSVLMGDFESAGGPQLFVHILKNSSPQRFMRTINIITRMLFDPLKTNEGSTTFPAIGLIINEIIISTLHLKRCIREDDKIEVLINIGTALLSFSDSLSEKDYIVQGIAYSLLTMYSNDPQNCTILENIHHFLPTLIIALPAVKNLDIISAVLTTMNYVCQCVETAASVPLLALCAACTIMINQALLIDLPSEVRNGAIEQLELTFSSYEAIMRSSSKFTMILAKDSLLKFLFIDSFEKLCNLVSLSRTLDDLTYLTFEKLISLIISIHTKTYNITDALCKSGFILFVRNLIESQQISHNFAGKLLLIIEDMAKINNNYTGEGLECIFYILESTIGDFEKQSKLIHSASKIIRDNECASLLFSGKGFIEKTIDLIDLVAEKFKASTLLSHKGKQNEIQEPIYTFLEAIVRLLSIEFSLTTPQKNGDISYELNRIKFQNYYSMISNGLIKSCIFSSPFSMQGIALIFELMNGFSGSLVIFNTGAVELLLLIIKKIDADAATAALKRLYDYAQSSLTNVKRLSESEAANLLIQIFYDVSINGPKHLILPLVKIIKLLSFEYLTLQTFIHLLQFIVQPTILHFRKENLLLPPWIANDSEQISNSWDTLQFLVDVTTPSFNGHDSVPFMRLGRFGSKDVNEPCYLSTILTEAGKTLPIGGFCFSCWLKVDMVTSDKMKDKLRGVVPLFSLNSESTDSCYFEVNFDVDKNCFIVVTTKGDSFSLFLFNAIASFNPFDWNHFSLNFRKNKKSTALSKAAISLYFNGLKCDSMHGDIIELEYPTQNSLLDIIIGRTVLLEKSMEFDGYSKEQSFDNSIILVDKWNIGPIHLFDEVLSTEQICSIFARGPSYVGSFQGESPLSDYLSTTVCYLLQKCDFSPKLVDQYLDNLGLKGYEMVVEPRLEPISLLTLNNNSEMSVLAHPVVTIDPSNVVPNSKSEIINPLNSLKQVIRNSSSNDGLMSLSTIFNVAYIGNSISFADCISSLGGPAILFPMLQEASTEQQICQSLLLIHSSVVNSNCNLKFMQINGYKIMSFILSLKPKEVITESVIQYLFDMSVHYQKTLNSTVSDSCLFVDTSAFYYLLLNQQVWDASKFSSSFSVLQHIKNLTSDDKYAILNSKRLSAMGVCRWILLLCLYGIEQTSHSTPFIVSNPCFKWSFKSWSAIEMSEYRDEAEPFFNIAISVVQTIMCIDLRKKDLEMILKIILYSFIPRYNEAGTSGSSINSPSDSQKTDYPFCNYSTSLSTSNISFLGQFRIYLLRLLFSLYDDHSEEAKYLQSKKPTIENGRKLSMAGVSSDSKDIMKLFRSIFSPNWFIGIFEKSIDLATKSHCLRLLGLFLQKDVTFRREFCSSEGFQVLNTILSSEPQEIPVILPLLAIFFNIPMQILLHPFQMKTIQSFIQILELDECDGPDISEPELSELSVPLLSILFDCYVNAFRAKDQLTAPLHLVVELLIGIFQYGMEKSHSFKLLMQHKYGMDIFATILLDCSDAYNDFGSKIFSDNASLDLSSFIIDDYISCQGVLSADVNDSPDKSNIRIVHFFDNIEHKIDINFLSPESHKMAWLLSLIFQQAILDHDNPLILYGFFTSFPKSYLNSYQYGYQKVIMEKFHSVIEVVIGSVTNLSDNHLNPVLNIINSIISIIPLVRANILNEYIQFEFLKICLDLTQKCFQNQFSSNEKSQRLIKEIVLTSRFFAVSCSNNISNSNPKFNRYVSRVAVLAVIKDNIGDLINSFVEDSIDVIISPMNRFIGRREGSADDKTPINSVMTDSQIPMTPGKKVNSSLNFAKSERNKVSIAFCMFLLNNCYALVFDDDSSIRYNAIRIMSYLATHRKTLIEHLVSTNAHTSTSRIWRSETIDDSSKDIDVFKEGLSKLIPNAAGKYELYLRGGTDDNDSEDNRFADFTFWVSDNNAKCDKVFSNIEGLLQGVLPSASEVEEIDRQIQSSKISRDKVIRGPISGVVSSMERAEDGQKLGEQVNLLLKRWSIYGVMYLSNGAIHWKNIWAVMQCTPVWGSQKELIKPSVGAIMWSLDQCEGPERTRKKLERYLNPTLDSKLLEDKVEDDSTHSVSNQSALDSLHSIADSSNTNISNDTVVQGKYNKSLENYSNFDKPLVDDDTHDMETFLKRVSIRGIIKKITGYRSSGDIIEKDLESDNLLSLNQYNIDKEESFQLDQENTSPTEPIHFTRERKFSNENDISDINYFESDSAVTNSEYFDESDLSVNTRPELTDSSISAKNDTGSSTKSSIKLDNGKLNSTDEDSEMSSKSQKSMILQEIVKGLIGSSEWTQGRVYNVKRIYGLEAQAAMLVVTKNNIHILSGFTLLKESKKNVDRQLDWSPTLNVTGDYHSKSIEKNTVLIKFTNSRDLNYTNWVSEIWRELLHSDLGYCKVPFDQVYSIFKRRHELKYTAMEITDIKGYSLLVSCQSVQDNEDLLITLIESDLPSSIFNKVIGSKNLQLLRGISNVYNRLIALFVSTITTVWQSGEITNFEYLMHINAAAGRSFQDLTQYPVFPWIIADYSSETLDFNDPKTFRDLSKPMGALGSKRAKQCRDRYQTMDEFYSEGMEGSSPPFFYGTHYSCAGYVLHYLMRLQPFSNMALALQGGSFDKADRLFISVESSWLSASRENLQDVRELIPEFFYLPEFLTNINKLDLGVTQKDEVVNDVALPRWAHNDPHEFIRIHREALESKYVSENLHNWIDLIFGFKQRGKAAIDSMNVFIHLTYEGEVDVDMITDTVLKNATIAQINNFGQTPSKIFNKTHPKKIVPEVAKKANDIVLIDPSALQWHSHLSPPLCVIGAMHYNLLNKISFTHVVVTGQTKGLPIGDIKLVRDKIVTTSTGSIFIPPLCKRTIKIGGPSGSLCIQPVNKITEGDKDCTIHENLHVMNITCTSINKTGDIIATGSDDTSVRVWNIINNATNQSKLKHYCTFIGHTNSIRCIDLNMEYSIIVSGGSDCKVIIWDFRTKKMIRILHNHREPIESVSVNSINGNILVLTVSELTIYTINGYLISSATFLNNKNDINNTTVGRVVLAVPTADWQDGVVAVTGHTGGHIHLWRLRSITESQPITDNRYIKHNESKSRQLFISLSPTKTHRADISAIKLCSTIIHSNSLLKQKDIVVKAFDDSRSLDLLVGDVEGHVSRWSPYKLDQLQNSDLQSIVLDSS